MHDPYRPMNGHPAGRPPSHADIMLSRMDRMLWDIRGEIGGLRQGQDMLADAIKEGFNRTHHAHARITRLEGRVEAVERRPMVPVPSAPTSLLVALTGLLAGFRELLPPLYHAVAIGLLLAAGLGMLTGPKVSEIAAVVSGLPKP